MNAPLPLTPPSVVARIAHLPNLAKAELDAFWHTLPSGITLLDLAINPPVLWDERRRRLMGAVNA